MVVNVYVSAVTTDNVSRHELVAWVNTLLQAQFSKIEEMATGAAYCQLTHILFPEHISLRKVKWNSKNDMDHINNWKILGVAWKEIGIDKPVQVDRMVKAKFQDNYEFLQWFYKFFNSNLHEDVENYDALSNRGGEPLPSGAKGPARSIAPRAAPAPRPAVRPAAPRAAPVAAAPKRAPVAAVPKASAAAAPVASASSAADKARIQELEACLVDREDALLTAEKERDFYFTKLRQIEDYLNAMTEEETPSKEIILSVLYAADGAGEDEQPEDVAAEVAAPAAAAVVDPLDDSETF